jgi:hypothetical protein
MMYLTGQGASQKSPKRESLSTHLFSSIIVAIFLSEKVLNKVYPNIASIYIFTTIQTFFLHLISLISQWLTHKKS